jgi:hypothetical protein
MSPYDFTYVPYDLGTYVKFRGRALFLKAFFIGFLSSKLSKHSFSKLLQFFRFFANFFVSVRVCCCGGVSATRRALLQPGQLCCRQLLGPGSCSSCSRPLLRHCRLHLPLPSLPGPNRHTGIRAPSLQWQPITRLQAVVCLRCSPNAGVHVKTHCSLPLSPS